MFYRAWIHTPNPQEETVMLSDPRSAAEMAAALATDGFLLSTAGKVIWAAYSDGHTETRTYHFTATGPVVLFKQYLVRLDEDVIKPGTQVTED